MTTEMNNLTETRETLRKARVSCFNDNIAWRILDNAVRYIDNQRNELLGREAQ